jgi:hypothetical protein
MLSAGVFSAVSSTNLISSRTSLRPTRSTKLFRQSALQREEALCTCREKEVWERTETLQTFTGLVRRCLSPGSRLTAVRLRQSSSLLPYALRTSAEALSSSLPAVHRVVPESERRGAVKCLARSNGTADRSGSGDRCGNSRSLAAC